MSFEAEEPSPPNDGRRVPKISPVCFCDNRYANLDRVNTWRGTSLQKTKRAAFAYFSLLWQKSMSPKAGQGNDDCHGYDPRLRRGGAMRASRPTSAFSILLDARCAPLRREAAQGIPSSGASRHLPPGEGFGGGASYRVSRGEDIVRPKCLTNAVRADKLYILVNRMR